jgi:hypothetical protein
MKHYGSIIYDRFCNKLVPLTNTLAYHGILLIRNFIVQAPGGNPTNVLGTKFTY